MRGGSSTEVLVPTAGQVVTRVVSDGFWIDSPGLPEGTVLGYRCRVDGIDRDDSFRVGEGPAGLFVYTGGMPESIQVLEVIPPPSSPSPRPLLSSSRSRSSFSPALPPSRPQPVIEHPSRPMFPSAY